VTQTRSTSTINFFSSSCFSMAPKHVTRSSLFFRTQRRISLFPPPLEPTFFSGTEEGDGSFSKEKQGRSFPPPCFLSPDPPENAAVLFLRKLSTGSLPPFSPAFQDQEGRARPLLIKVKISFLVAFLPFLFPGGPTGPPHDPFFFSSVPSIFS